MKIKLIGAVILAATCMPFPAYPATEAPISSTGAVEAVKEPGPATGPASTSKPGKSRFVLLVDADLRGGFTAERDSKTVWGVAGHAMVLPAWQVTDRGVLLPIYMFSGDLADRVLEEAILFQRRQSHAISLGWKQGFSGRLEGKLAGEAAYNLTQETTAEKFGKGLYDYRDFGGRATVTWKLVRDGREEPVQGTLRAYKRAYPNYLSLAEQNRDFLIQNNPSAAASIGDKEKRPKDFIGGDFGLSAVRWIARALRGTAEYGLTLRKYGDRYLRTDQGLFSGDKRTDLIHRLEARVDYGGFPSFPAWTSVEGTFFGSNGNQYDTSQPEKPYTPSFFQFATVTWRTRVSWEIPLGARPLPFVYVGTGVGLLGYTDRRAQDEGGINQPARQRDQTYSLDLGGGWPVTRRFGVVLGFTGMMVKSNNEYEQFIRYSYKLLTGTLGVTYRL